MDCSLVAPAALCSALILLTTELSSQAHLASFLTKTNNKLFKQSLTMANFVPDPVPWGPQTWEQPSDLRRAKQLLGKMREAKTKAARKEDGFPVAKISGVIQQAHLEWSRLDKEIADHLIAVGGRANATHCMLSHNPIGLSNGDTDEETIKRKKARIAIARVMVHNRQME